MVTNRFEYWALRYNQRNNQDAPTFCVFHAPASQILMWAAINRLSRDDPTAIQRDPKKSRISAIKRFFLTEPRNTVPTSVILTLDNCEIQEATSVAIDARSYPTKDLIKLTVTVSEGASEADKPGLVIDGQHRLKGIAEYGDDTHVNVVVLLNADADEKAFQFLVINNKASKVSPDHIRALNVNYSNALPARLLTARLAVSENVSSVHIADSDSDSPFKGLIKWPNNWVYKEAEPKKTGFIAPSAIEAAISHIKSKRIADLDDDETVDDFFLSMWSEVKLKWGDLFSQRSDANPTKLLEKASIITLTEFLLGQLISISRSKHSRFSLSDMSKVRENTRDLLSNLDPVFWVVNWKSASYDTRAGRDLLVEAIERMHGNVADGRDWHLELDTVIDLSS
jgi:DGQHR domain-containing protein